MRWRRRCGGAGRFKGPGAETLPTFLQVDFGLVRGADGSIQPKLVELQAFASLYGFQLAVAEAYRDAFGLPLAPALSRRSRRGDLSRADGGRHRRRPDPREVVLMEIEPRAQKTWPDFVVTEQMWGVRAIDVSEVRREGRRLYYRRDGKATQIKRIYNRVIPDELERKRIQLPLATATISTSSGRDTRPGTSGSASSRFRSCATPRCRRRIFSTASRACPRSRSLSAEAAVFVRRRRDHFCANRCADCRDPDGRAEEYILQERINFTPVIDTPEGPRRSRFA